MSSLEIQLDPIKFQVRLNWTCQSCLNKAKNVRGGNGGKKRKTSAFRNSTHSWGFSKALAGFLFPRFTLLGLGIEMCVKKQMLSCVSHFFLHLKTEVGDLLECSTHYLWAFVMFQQIDLAFFLLKSFLESELCYRMRVSLSIKIEQWIWIYSHNIKQWLLARLFVFVQKKLFYAKREEVLISILQ